MHLSHGIARYRGLKLLTKEQQAEEHLILEFHGETKIYVPVSKIELVQKYVGGTKTRPTLARVGGKLWTRRRRPRKKPSATGGRHARPASREGDQAGNQFRRRHGLAAGVRLFVPLSRHGRPGHGHRGHQARHARPAADGSPAVRRRRLRQDGNGHARRVQSRRRRLPGGLAGADYHSRRAALPHLSRRMAAFPFTIKSLFSRFATPKESSESSQGSPRAASIL